MNSELATPQGHTMEAPQQMLARALDAAIAQGNGMEVVKAILDQQKWMILHSEEEAFNEALKRIQKALNKIPKRGYNKETKSFYALAEDVDDELQKHLDAEGMTLSFRPAVSDKPEEVVIIGTLALGAFTKEYPLPMPADGKGAKGGGVMSRTHATGSAITYGKRYLKDLIFDLRFTKDDDGNGASGVTNEQAGEWIDAIRDANTPESTMSLWKQAVDVAKDRTPIDYRAMTVFTEARDERLKALRKAQ